MSERLKKLTSELPANLFCRQLPPDLPLASGLSSLDTWLNGGLGWGRISEWGMPHGSDTRKLLLKFLKQQNKNFLWIHATSLEDVYPPAWASYIDLNKAYFIQSDAPIKELKACFLDDYFSIIIIDSPTKLNLGDLAFLSAQNRSLMQHSFLLRPFYLSSKRGNPYAQFRINVFKNSPESFLLKKLRGKGSNSPLALNLNEVPLYECSSSFL